MRSISSRLFLILVLSTGLIWLAAVVWIFLSTRAEIETVLDARLMEAGRMVSSLISSQDIELASSDASLPRFSVPSNSSYDRQLSCQIWSLQGTLIGSSEGAPAQELSQHTDGFSETMIDGEAWRVYALTNPDLGIRVLVGDNLRMRDRLVSDVIRGFLLPAVLILPALAGLLWLSVKRGLAPLSRIAGDLERRPASDLSPIEDAEAAKEIRPVLRSLNGLFARVAGMRERERNFTTFAAHELRTPLAGLMTQAQVALATDKHELREKALRQIVVGVDRTGRLVRQLLDMAAIEAAEQPEAAGIIVPSENLYGLFDELAPGRKNVSIAIAPELAEITLSMDPVLFELAARNLLENALHHSPEGGTVHCRLIEEGGQHLLVIEDDGPGIPEDELPRATERFFRGSNRAQVGSGLGLAIAELALHRSGSMLKLRNREAGGLQAVIVLPASRIS